MLIINIIILSSFANCDINKTVYKIKHILNKYKTYRHRRCVVPKQMETSSSVQNFVEKTLNFFDKTERYGEYFKYFNVSDCKESDESYVNHHVLEGLILSQDMPDTHWKEYKSVHKKEYASHHHEMAALTKWRHNLRRTAQHNQDYLEGKQSFSLHLNHLADLNSMDYFTKMLKFIETFPLFDPAEDYHKSTYRNSLHRRVPKKVDWRQKGFKPKREEQYDCGACYAFAVTHALQAQVYKRHGDWRELSPQQIVDCSWKDGNMGCDGGSLRAALKYAARDGLIMENHYPYTGRRGRCHYNRRYVRAKARRWATLPPGDEDAIERALATIGPLAVAVNAAPFTFQLYRSGIYDDPFCTPWKLNHAMLLVGYTPRYWILLNWWGKKWGEDGYIRIRRGFNRCGVANMATYVEL